MRLQLHVWGLTCVLAHGCLPDSMLICRRARDAAVAATGTENSGDLELRFEGLPKDEAALEVRTASTWLLLAGDPMMGIMAELAALFAAHGSSAVS